MVITQRFKSNYYFFVHSKAVFLKCFPKQLPYLINWWIICHSSDISSHHYMSSEFNHQFASVEPHNDLGTMKITLLCQVSHKQRNIKSWDPQHHLVLKEICYIQPPCNEVPRYNTISHKGIAIVQPCSIENQKAAIIRAARSDRRSRLIGQFFWLFPGDREILCVCTIHEKYK